MSLSKTKLLKRSSSVTVNARHTRCLLIVITGRFINCINLQCPVTLYSSTISLFLLDSVFSQNQRVWFTILSVNLLQIAHLFANCLDIAILRIFVDLWFITESDGEVLEMTMAVSGLSASNSFESSRHVISFAFSERLCLFVILTLSLIVRFHAIFPGNTPVSRYVSRVGIKLYFCKSL